jgi:hypothetical protein
MFRLLIALGLTVLLLVVVSSDEDMVYSNHRTPGSREWKAFDVRTRIAFVLYSAVLAALFCRDFVTAITLANHRRKSRSIPRGFPVILPSEPARLIEGRNDSVVLLRWAPPQKRNERLHDT